MSSDRGAPETHGLRRALMRQIVVEDLHKAYVISSYIYILFWPKISAKTTEILAKDTSNA